MDVNATLLAEYKSNACFRMEEALRMLELSLKEVEETELWIRPNSKLNSIGNLLLHLCGNIRQYIHSGIGKRRDDRERNEEFNVNNKLGKDDLSSILRSTIKEAQEYINTASLEDYLEIKSIQGFELSGIGAVLHAVEHLSYHTGQIAFWVKYRKDIDLGFYKGMDLNKLNQ